MLFIQSILDDAIQCLTCAILFHAGNICQYVFQSSANPLDHFLDLELLESMEPMKHRTPVKDEW